MGRITYVTIAGKNYAMSFSLGASKKIIGKFGSANKMKLKLEKSSEMEKIDIVTDMLELLISQGCAYKNYFEKDFPAPDDAPIKEGKWIPIAKEEIETAIDISEIESLVDCISTCVNGGGKKEVETRTEGKNAKSGQE